MDERETRLIRQAQGGNTIAFAQLVALHDRRVLQLAQQLLNDPRDAEDVYQDIFMSVFRKLASFRFESAFSTWLYRIVVNHCINYRKRRTRTRHESFEQHTIVFEEESVPQFEDDGLDPERELLNRELGQEITSALATLSEKQRAVFVLRHFHGHKLQEIADILDTAEGTVKNYLFRATQHLQKRLRAYHENRL
ncbi:RNA polymerase sigma factor [candidate division KSB1 bacterium]|nr:RNA polymerase sigma factor [candidate division KSB1 bacterium]